MKLQESLINRLQETMTNPTPEVGMGATLLLYSDRHAYTVIEVISPRRIILQRDHEIRIDSNGMSDDQLYRYEPNTSAPKMLATLRRDNKWHEGTTMQGAVFVLGRRNAYHDYSF